MRETLLFDFLVEHIRQVKKVDQVLAEYTLQRDLGFSSLNFITMIVSVCDEFDIDVGELAEEELGKVVTVGDVFVLLKAASAAAHLDRNAIPNICIDKRYCAFFDVDGTIINTRSVLSFMEFLRTEVPLRGVEFEQYRGALRERVVAGVPREELNRFYYTLYRGFSVNQIAELGQRWFAQAGEQPGFYNHDAITALAHHRYLGASVVLVSGSFPALLDPLSRHIGADAVLCTRLEIEAGHYTGALLGVACIGQGKVQPMLEYAASACIDLDACYAYGDDASDLPMMNLVGNPVMLTPSEAYHSEIGRVLGAPTPQATEEGAACRH